MMKRTGWRRRRPAVDAQIIAELTVIAEHHAWSEPPPAQHQRERPPPRPLDGARSRENVA